MIIEECFFIDIEFEKFNIINIPSKFQFEKVILSNNYQKKIYEGECNNYYKILKVDNKYKLYYRALNNSYLVNKKLNSIINPCHDKECFCIAESIDGLNFEKIIINRNNIIKKGNFCHNFFPNYVNDKYIGISGTESQNSGLYLFESDDGIKWDEGKKIITKDLILNYYKHKNHFDSHNSINYNKLDNFYYIHLRHNNFNDNRMTQLLKTKDFKTFLPSKLININYNYNYNIYNLNVSKTDEYNYFISIPNYASNHNILDINNKRINIKKKEIKNLLISKDGVNFIEFIPKINLKNINKNCEICPVNGFVKSLDNKKLYFYIQNNVYEKNHEIQCYSIPYNRFNGFFSNNYGFIKSNKLNLLNYEIELNFKTISKKSFIIVELLDEYNKRINISKIIKGNSFNKNIEWFYQEFKELDNYYLKFHLYNSIIYSFKYKLDNIINLDYIWSKGIYKRTNYMLKNTSTKPDEKNMIKMIKNENDFIWIRNNLKKYKKRDLEYLYINLNKLSKKKIIIIGDGDDPIPSSYDTCIFNKILKCKNIEKIFIQNYDGSIKHKKIFHYPIGLDLHTPRFLLDFNYLDKINYYIELRKSGIDFKLNRIFCDTHLSKTHEDRNIMFNKIKNSNYIDFLHEKLDFKEILIKYRNYKFVLSPRGNGLDCHRTWELFLLGCIVIMETSPLDDMWINNNLPVVILKDYDELNNINLNLRLEFWFKRYKNLTDIDNILPKFKNSYWLNK
tara:strand:- start:1533 stop:3731 length:2199 start_codon:yes stop_codon:yes gene_type:complete